ncbi:hypothetical protein HK101_006210 [Irineochytrium annulatum]|nr:hypothetical protein HK101_006210 [Irineochytrium annulatum]
MRERLTLWQDPPLDFKCKDKFLVQAVKITNLESDDLQELWSRAENLKKVDPEAAKELICEKKLRCVFLPPLGGAVADSTPTHQLDSTPTATLEKADPRGARTASVGSKVDSVQDPDRDLREARETIKRLQAACEGYKSEIDRLNLLRQRRGAGTSGGDGGSAIDGGSNAGAMASKGINFQVALLMALIAFLLGAYLL